MDTTKWKQRRLHRRGVAVDYVPDAHDKGSQVLSFFRLKACSFFSQLRTAVSTGLSLNPHSGTDFPLVYRLYWPTTESISGFLYRFVKTVRTASQTHGMLTQPMTTRSLSLLERDPASIPHADIFRLRSDDAALLPLLENMSRPTCDSTDRKSVV